MSINAYGRCVCVTATIAPSSNGWFACNARCVSDTCTRQLTAVLALTPPHLLYHEHRIIKRCHYQLISKAGPDQVLWFSILEERRQPRWRHCISVRIHYSLQANLGYINFGTRLLRARQHTFRYFQPMLPLSCLSRVYSNSLQALETTSPSQLATVSDPNQPFALEGLCSDVNITKLVLCKRSNSHSVFTVCGKDQASGHESRKNVGHIHLKYSCAEACLLKQAKLRKAQ